MAVCVCMCGRLLDQLGNILKLHVKMLMFDKPTV